jgi:DHA1 family bicyclomycin/chloramphenicol resistance-like MFS transporter
MIGLFIRETLPAERRQPFHLRTTLGNFATLFRHKRVLSYMLASGFQLRRDVLFPERRAVCLYQY